MADPVKHKHIIEGFSDDFQEMRKDFPSYSHDLRLEHFLLYWRHSQMDCLFANRFDPRELFESIVEINRKLISIVTNDTVDSDAKLISLYLLLCISAKQPSRLRRKIRMTCHDAVKINKLCDEIKLSRGHDGAQFCWYRLRKTEAIDFVEEKLIFGPSMLMRGRHQNLEEDETSSIDPLVQARKDTTEFIEGKLDPAITDLDHISSHYKSMKDLLKLDEANDATVELDSKGSLNDYVDQAKNLLRDYKASQTG